MKYLSTLILILFNCFYVFGQDTPMLKPLDTPSKKMGASIGELSKSDSNNTSLPKKITTHFPIFKAKIAKPILKDSIDLNKNIPSEIATDTQKIAVEVDSTIKLKKQGEQKPPKLNNPKNAFLIPYLPFDKKPLFRVNSFRKQFQIWDNLFFYTLLIPFLLLGIVRQIYPKFLSGIFAQFFRSSVRQRYIRDGLQPKLSALLLNCFFILNFGIYTSIILNKHLVISLHPFLFTIFCIVCFILIYIIKYIIIIFIGWIFSEKEASKQYIYLIFLNNKVFGTFLLPFLPALAYVDGDISTIFQTLSFFIVISALCYRYIIGFSSIAALIGVGPLHFFLYMCAFELLPIALLFKAFYVHV